LFEEARRHRRRRWITFAAIALLVLAAGAAAFDAFGRRGHQPHTVPVYRNGVLASVPEQTVVLLVDVSGSMRASDVGPTRLGAAIAGMRAFLAELPKQLQVGVVAFSSSAEVRLAPTRDHRAVLDALGTLSPLAGTALGDGLATAVKLTVDSLRKQGIRRAPGHSLPATIVLESDGAQNRGSVDPRPAAEQAKAAGIRVDGVALGTRNGTVQLGFGRFQNRIPVPPDPSTVLMISQLTGGEAVSAPSAKRLDAFYRKLGASIGG
jgi:Ca-activated chloride channel homolog